MNSDHYGMGDALDISPEVTALIGENFTFHDALFTGVNFSKDVNPKDEDPTLLFDLLVDFKSTYWERVAVIATLIGSTALTIERPRDWVYDFKVERIEGGFNLRWMDNETGYPMITARAERLRVTLGAD